MNAASRTFAYTLAVAVLLAALPNRGLAKVGTGKAPIAISPAGGFAAAVAAIEKAIGVKGEPVELHGKKLALAEGRAFGMEATIASRLLAGSHADFRKAGLYLFRHERSFGMGDAHDHVVLLPVNDRDAVIRLVGTRDAAKKKTTDEIVAWLRALDKDEPFELDEIGDDYVAGRFKAVPKDPTALARRLAEFAPELTKGGAADAIQKLASDIQANRTLYLIW